MLLRRPSRMEVSVNYLRVSSNGPRNPGNCWHPEIVAEIFLDKTREKVKMEKMEREHYASALKLG